MEKTKGKERKATRIFLTPNLFDIDMMEREVRVGEKVGVFEGKLSNLSTRRTKPTKPTKPKKPTLVNGCGDDVGG